MPLELTFTVPTRPDVLTVMVCLALELVSVKIGVSVTDEPSSCTEAEIALVVTVPLLLPPISSPKFKTLKRGHRGPHIATLDIE